MTVEMLFSPEVKAYRFSAQHPMQPQRFSLAVELAEAWGLLGGDDVELVSPTAATDDELLRVHDAGYLEAVRGASESPLEWPGGFGIGPGDTPAFRSMHRAAALAAGATTAGLRDVVTGACTRAFSPAGGMHHAHRDRAAGFCIYNDPAVAIASVIAEIPGLRVAYVDLDAHHGDGVEEAFWRRSDVLTLSVHESGAYLYPGTGSTREIGAGAGTGYALNVPLPPDADDASYAMVLEGVVGPALQAFSPDVIVAQLGADSHRADPLSHLDTTVRGQYTVAASLVSLADRLCEGRIMATGGGGYDAYSAAPRAWACVFSALLGEEPPERLPETWRAAAEKASEWTVQLPLRTFDERATAPTDEARERAKQGTQAVIEQLRHSHPLLSHGA